MKENYTHITLILDRSGSMMSVRGDVIGGVNRFIEEQKAVPGECTFTLVQFDDSDPYETIVDFKPIAEVKPLGDEYSPRGWTPLYDAVGLGIVRTGEKLASLPGDQRPSKVVFVTQTDGMENRSKEYTRERVAAMTKDQTEKYGWQFVYLGANQDALAVGASIGTSRGTSANYAEQKTSGAIQLCSANVASYRTGAKKDMDWSEEQRKQLSNS